MKSKLKSKNRSKMHSKTISNKIADDTNMSIFMKSAITPFQFKA